MPAKPYRLTVGSPRSAIPGFTNAHIQAAVDRCALLGGGVVELSAGTFRMADSLHLRTGVSVRGQGAATVLLKNPMKSAAITCFLGYGHRDLEVDNPDAFEPGDGVLIRDNNAHGFYTTVATLVRREGDVWITNRPHHHDYLGTNGGVAETLFPLVSAEAITDAVLENICLEGNSKQNPVKANGCRACGFLALNAHRLTVRNVTVRDYNGDGFGFQTCDDFVAAGCVVENCTGNGFHPGSGSNRFLMTGCTARKNKGCGLFYCLRVRHGLLEDSLFEKNGLFGVSVGERDTDSINRNLTIRLNGGAGFYVRACNKANAPHRTLIEGCTLERNAAGKQESDAEIILQGEAEGLRVIGNTIRPRPGKTGILIRKGTPPCELKDNRITLKKLV
jgi:hypothetical protein